MNKESGKSTINNFDSSKNIETVDHIFIKEIGNK
jgi:hypothetical protein